jgi:hypothetical protein
MLASTNIREELEGELAVQKQKELIEAARTIPGVTAAGAVRETPLSGARRVIPVYRPGTTEFMPENQALTTHKYPMSPEYLEAAGTRLLHGRDVSWHTASDALVLVVRSSLAPEDVATALRHRLDRAQPNVPVTLRTWPEALERVVYPARVDHPW